MAAKTSSCFHFYRYVIPTGLSFLASRGVSSLIKCFAIFFFRIIYLQPHAATFCFLFQVPKNTNFQFDCFSAFQVSGSMFQVNPFLILLFVSFRRWGLCVVEHLPVAATFSLLQFFTTIIPGLSAFSPMGTDFC